MRGYQRVGFGYDSHRFVAGGPLILGGIEIPFEYGLLGHSDADVLLHAVGDALLGAAAAGDLGSRFPDDDPAWKNVSSRVILEDIRKIIGQCGYVAYNVDATVILENPRLRPHIPLMEETIADILRLSKDRVSVKASTNEKMGFTGRGEGIAAFSIVTVLESNSQP